MITLYGFGPAFGVIDASPFVVKVDLFLKLAGLEYQTVNDVNNLKKSPKGKLPFITDGDKTIADSHFILEYLTEKYQVNIDDHLSEEQKAQALLYSKALDESLYWILVYSRWIKEDTWPIVRDTFFADLPAPLKLFVPGLVQRDVKKTLKGQGFGRHSESELLALAKNYFCALSTLLADKPYFFGDKISSFDVLAYSMLCEVISVDYFNNFNQLARSYDNLVAFCQRIEQTYYG
ncbi:glutathione S-transferase family protein [Thalassotalea marina]|uniref:GST N-terminal domain-containing protein n=1 Tax=Thalassotalea marina TaxID=1673741 RepID=A0A919BD56_9GAMM|nr:glutathione S-transferase family protein [Thalassotalea marina]GHF84428.1 hypothetical protein GCM10017161_09810 [Thalassotalea marina]